MRKPKDRFRIPGTKRGYANRIFKNVLTSTEIKSARV